LPVRMTHHREWNLACKVYIGNLGNTASKYEIEDAFKEYGKLKNVWVARNPPGFAFVEFEDERDAEDAVRALDGTRICGSRAQVEMSTGRSRDKGGRDGGGRGGRGRDRDFGGRDRGFGGGGDRDRGGRGGGRDDRSGGRDRGGRRDRSRSRSPRGGGGGYGGGRDGGSRGGGGGGRRRSPTGSPSRSESRDRSYSRDRMD